MTGRILRRAGIAHRLASGGWAVDFGGQFPTWVPDRESALDLLDSLDHPAGPGVAVAQSPRGDGTVPGSRSPRIEPGTTKTSRGAGVVGASTSRAVGAPASAAT